MFERKDNELISAAHQYGPTVEAPKRSAAIKVFSSLVVIILLIVKLTNT